VRKIYLTLLSLLTYQKEEASISEKKETETKAASHQKKKPKGSLSGSWKLEERGRLGGGYYCKCVTMALVYSVYDIGLYVKCP
jgi:hypothetical protein